jgi:uncharacterized protein (DUF433 family)
MVDYKEHIQSNPQIMLGKPTIKGTRITVELLLWKIAGGYTFEEILEMYPHLKLDDILASIAYAAAIIESEEVIAAV